MNDTRRMYPAASLAALTILAACSATRPPARQPAAAPRPEPQSSVDAKRQSEFDRSQDRWHGAPVKELVGKLGQPTLKAHQADGHAVYVYSKSGKLNGPTGPVDFRCVVRYVLDDKGERVMGHTIEGC